MDDRPVESSQFSCARFGKDTQIDIYSILKPIIHGTVLPATMVREMHCQNENKKGYVSIVKQVAMRISRPQKTILSIGLLIVFVDCMFPPYILVLEGPTGQQYGMPLSRGRRFLLKQGLNQSDADFERGLGIKTPSENSQFFFTRINYRQLGLQVLIVALVTVAAFVVTTLVLRRRAIPNQPI